VNDRPIPRWLARLDEPTITDIYLALVAAPGELRAWLATRLRRKIR
jgi:hypothetical protein